MASESSSRTGPNVWARDRHTTSLQSRSVSYTGSRSTRWSEKCTSFLRSRVSMARPAYEERRGLDKGPWFRPRFDRLMGRAWPNGPARAGIRIAEEELRAEVQAVIRLARR